jgi:hypothetical protein
MKKQILSPFQFVENVLWLRRPFSENAGLRLALRVTGVAAFLGAAIGMFGLALSNRTPSELNSYFLLKSLMIVLGSAIAARAVILLLLDRGVISIAALEAKGSRFVEIIPIIGIICGTLVLILGFTFREPQLFTEGLAIFLAPVYFWGVRSAVPSRFSAAALVLCVVGLAIVAYNRDVHGVVWISACAWTAGVLQGRASERALAERVSAQTPGTEKTAKESLSPGAV